VNSQLVLSLVIIEDEAHGFRRVVGRDGASMWCGHGVFVHNLVKISALASWL
jgi:hypothetical protein